MSGRRLVVCGAHNVALLPAHPGDVGQHLVHHHVVHLTSRLIGVVYRVLVASLHSQLPFLVHVSPPHYLCSKAATKAVHHLQLRRDGVQGSLQVALRHK